MRQHWDQYLNVKQLIEACSPRLVVECGVAEGRNTDNLVRARKDLGYRLVCINNAMVADFSDWIIQEELEFITGISYLELPKFEEPVDFCIIDTDHNYWTLNEELKALTGVAPPGAIACLHDTVTFGKNNGIMGEGYAPNKTRYPREEIVEASGRGLGMLDAIQSAIESGAWRKIRESQEAHGAMALERI